MPRPNRSHLRDKRPLHSCQAGSRATWLAGPSRQDADPAAVAAGEKDFHTFAPVLNAQLETHKFITGSELTLAVFSVGACFSYAAASGLPWNDYTHIRAWWWRLNEVPAWKNTAPKLG